ncbi:MAG: hypothetical protein Kow0077_32290 [Anaerolineae bacterium]
MTRWQAGCTRRRRSAIRAGAQELSTLDAIQERTMLEIPPLLLAFCGFVLSGLMFGLLIFILLLPRKKRNRLLRELMPTPEEIAHIVIMDELLDDD